MHAVYESDDIPLPSVLTQSDSASMDGTIEFLGRKVQYKVEGSFHSGRRPWIWSAKATDLQTGITASSLMNQSTELFIY
jgi:hypothetical protein